MRLPVADYGGTERIVVWLARGLAERGHDVTVIAARGSRIPEARVVEIDPAATRRQGGPDLTPWLPHGTDIVHAHVPLAHPPRDVPFLWTLHGNHEQTSTLAAGAVGLSADHARRHGLTRWVYNGLDPAEYRFQREKEKFDLFLGRLHSVKGWQWAVEGARRAKRDLVVAGGWRPTLRHGLRFAGRVGGERKTALLADAACLWAPARWPEPFGLTTIEAMVSGTPVLGTREGALPEIVTPESGRLGNSLEELIAMRDEVSRLDADAVRQRVLDHFTHRTMAAVYERVYHELQ